MLDTRKVAILRAVVHDYVETSRPVGSERLIEVYRLECKSATVRNELADLSTMGYLVQPHTSAGRIPTDRGYRFYVDTLMDRASALTATDRRKAQRQALSAGNAIEDMVQATCRILAEITACTSVATDPAANVNSIRRVYLTSASPRTLLIVVLMGSGQVGHRLLELGSVPASSSLDRVARAVTGAVENLDADALAPVLDLQPPAGLPIQLHELYRQALAEAVDFCRAATRRRLYTDGAAQMLRQPEFQDVTRLEALLTALEHQATLNRAFTLALRSNQVAILIGSENASPALQPFSVVVAPYSIGNRAAGCVGIVGPTRMNYGRAAAAVDMMGRSLSASLTHVAAM